MRSSVETLHHAGHSEIECLRCGTLRLKRIDGSGDAGACANCGELGWEYPSALSDAERAAYRRRLRPQFGYLRLL